MKIAIIHRSFALVGGAERVIIDKANYLSDLGYQVMLISYEQGNHSLPYKLHESVQHVDLNCRFFTLSSYPAIIHLCRFVLLKRKFRHNIKSVVRLFKPDVIVMASDWHILIGDVVDSVAHIPVIAEFHNVYDYIMRKVGVSENWLKKNVIRMLQWLVLKKLNKCSCLVALTEGDANCWRQHFNNVCVIPNPVAFFPEVIDDIPKDFGRIIFVGRFNREKRIDRLIEAFSYIAERYPLWHIDIFGEGNEKPIIEQKIVDLNLEKRVIIHNPTKEIVNEYKRSEMLVLCSEHEAYSLVLVEAMACGVPCIAMDCPSGPREIIKDGETGLLVPNGNVCELSEKIEWLINHDDERIKMGENARQFAQSRKLSVVMEKWIKVYSDLRQ